MSSVKWFKMTLLSHLSLHLYASLPILLWIKYLEVIGLKVQLTVRAGFRDLQVRVIINFIFIVIATEIIFYRKGWVLNFVIALSRCFRNESQFSRKLFSLITYRIFSMLAFSIPPWLDKKVLMLCNDYCLYHLSFW